MFELLLIADALLLGVVCGLAWRRSRARQAVAEARAEAAVIVEQARGVAELIEGEGQARAQEEILEIQRAGEDEQDRFAEETGHIEERVIKRDGRLEQAEGALDKRKREIDGRYRQVRVVGEEAKDLRTQAKALADSRQPMLEERAGNTAGELRRQIAEALVEEVRSASADRLRNLDANEAEDPAREAKRVMSIAFDRYTGHCPRERGTSAIVLTREEFAKLQGVDAERMATLSRVSGVNLLFSDQGDSLRLDTGDGVARELCRRVIARFLGDDRHREAEPLIETIRRDLERDIRERGMQAFKALGLAPAAQEIVDLVGKLYWRTSYTQNQHRHSIEASWLAGLMAAELGLDPLVARRAALLHDIGKALTHNTEGSHALIGGEIARRCHEPEDVANAIASHHGEEPPATPYSPLATAADAISGARPGARREMVEAYDERIEDLEKIASGFSGVEAAFAVQAGREIRVHVDEGRVKDSELQDLSARIAKKISTDMTFPGQIRVTVIRELRAIEVAN